MLATPFKPTHMAEEMTEKEVTQLFNNAYQLQKHNPNELQGIMEKIGDKTSEKYQVLLAGKRQYEKDVFHGKALPPKEKDNGHDR